MLAVATGCGTARTCTLAWCEGAASVRVYNLSPSLRYPLSERACFDGRCADLHIGRTPLPTRGAIALACTGTGRQECNDLRNRLGFVDVTFRDTPIGSGSHLASLVLRDAGGVIVMRSSQPLRLVKNAPNGEKCGPICWQGAANFQ